MTCVSVIVPVYNQAEYLESALESVREQTRDDWECIIVNDGSTDNSEQVIDRCAAVDTRFRRVFQNNQGVSAARNLGLRMAQGKYVLFLDADDTIHGHMLELLVGVLERNQDIDVAYGGYDVTDTAGNVIRRVSVPASRKDHHVERLLIANLFPINAAISRRKTVMEHGIEFPQEEGPEDWIFWLWLAMEGARFSPVERIVCCYRRRRRSRSSHVLRQTLGAERFLKEAILRASLEHGISEDFEQVAFAALYLRRYLDAIEFKDERARYYCKSKLGDLTWLPLIGLSRYHTYILGLYLDIQEATGEFPLMRPMVSARRLARNVIGRTRVGRARKPPGSA